MKTAPHFKVKRLRHLNTLLTSVLLTSSLWLVGCQSMPMSTSTTATNADNTPSAAKTALASALQKQRRQSFAYRSNVEITNDQQFTNIDPKELVANDYVDSYCEETHDQAYADLSIQAEAIGSKVSATSFEAQRELIKQNYLECSKAYEAWESNAYDSYYDDYDYDYEESYEDPEDSDQEDDEYVTIEGSEKDSAADSSTDSPTKESVNVETVGSAGATVFETNSIKISNADSAVAEDTSKKDSQSAYVAPYYQELFDNYEDKTSVLDIKKAKLLDAYLLKPLSINAQGVYQPLAGKFTMLASTQYKSRNSHTSVNQPVYIDFKTGTIYLWADNFAILNSEFLDDKLGLKWQNKWLRLAIDDGTLPEGFGRAIIKAHFDATDHAYEQAPVSQFDFVAPSSLLSLSPAIPKQQLTPMLQSKRIVRRVQDNDSYEQNSLTYLRHFYELIGNQYPELIDEDIDADSLRSILSAESFTSQNIAKTLLALINKKINGEDDVDVDTDTDTDTVTDTDTDTDSDADADADADVEKDNFSVQELYGFDGRGKLQWQHWRNLEEVTEPGLNKANDEITVNVLQQYLPIRSQEIAFPNLPNDMQMPSLSNSIDIRAYASELAQYYRDGNGTTKGKALFEMLTSLQEKDEDLEDDADSDTDTDSESESESESESDGDADAADEASVEYD